MKSLRNRKIHQVLLAATFIVMSTAAAWAGDCQCGLCTDKCNTCCLKCDIEDAKKSGFDVECKQICIPRVVFPWQKSCCNPCANNGACVRTVKVLKTVDYKCKERTYKWTPAMVGGCDCECGTSSCCDTGCCDTGSGCGLFGKNTPAVPSASGTENLPRDTIILRASVAEPVPAGGSAAARYTSKESNKAAAEPAVKVATSFLKMIGG